MKTAGISKVKDALLFFFFVFLLSSFSKHNTPVQQGSKKADLTVQHLKAAVAQPVQLRSFPPLPEKPFFNLSHVTAAHHLDQQIALQLKRSAQVRLLNPTRCRELYYHLFSPEDDDLFS